MKLINNRIKIGTASIVVFFILGFIIPLFYWSVHPMTRQAYPRNLPVSFSHFLGTTSQGQDIFQLLVFSLRNSLIIGLSVALIATIIGVFAGLSSGFIGGLYDKLVTFLMDSFIVIPSLPILILMASLLKGQASMIIIIIVLIVFNWPWPARQTRSVALSMKEREFINMAHFSGFGTFSILRNEIFPYIFSWSMGNFINTVLVAIATEMGLAVIGLSSVETPTLGSMIYWAMQYHALLGKKWLWIGSPVLVTILLFVGLFYFSSGIVQYSSTKRGQR